MAPRLKPLVDRTIGFAHRGARAHAPENTLESFHLAAEFGATGMESDVWLTADRVAVLDHDGVHRRRWRNHPISEVRHAELGSHIPTIEEFYDSLGTDFEFSLDVKDPRAFDAVIAGARNAGGNAEHKLWLCHPDYRQLIGWREHTEARLIDSTRLSKLDETFESRMNKLRSLGIDGINLRLPDWQSGMVTTAHRFERFALGWDAQKPREIATLIDMGIDGVFSDHSDRLAEALLQFFGPRPGGSHHRSERDH